VNEAIAAYINIFISGSGDHPNI